MTQTNSSMQTPYHQLTSEERGEIQALHDQGFLQATIARKLGYNRSTICRELKRGSVKQRDSSYLFYYRYFADTAQVYHEQRRAKCYAHNLLDKDATFFRMLNKHFKASFNANSIDEFVGRFKLMHPHYHCPSTPTGPSTPTVYRYIDQGLLKIKNIDLPMKLRRQRRKHHGHGHAPYHKRLGPTIEDRPQEVEQRQVPDHWEGDLVKGVRRKNQPALMTLTERKTRFEIVTMIPDYHASTCLNTLQGIINRHPKWFKSITFDNGSEFSTLTKITGAVIYYAHPYSPWERGSNEQCNGLLRQFFPKGKSMRNKSSSYVQKAMKAINDKPRKLLHYHTAKELFSKTLAS